MRDILVDIQAKLRAGAYQNEEHVRLSLVARVLQGLGWDIWDPRQVNAEFAPVRAEDNTKVDVALFATLREPSVFIEAKGVGKLANSQEIQKDERQLRDYNKNITASLCVLTDGRTWRFYLPKISGEFARKCFKVLDLSSDNAEDIEAALQSFLGKSAIEKGEAVREAKALLRLTQKQRAMEECLSQARRLTQEPPYPSLPDALVSLLVEQGFEVTRTEAEDFLGGRGSGARIREGEDERTEDKDDDVPAGVIELLPEHPGSLKFTSVIEGQLGELHDRRWNGLVRCGVKLAIQRGKSVADLREWMTTQVEEGHVTNRGFQPVPETNVSVPGMDANRAWDNALILARNLSLPIRVRFRWGFQDDVEVEKRGKEGLLRWNP